MKEFAFKVALPDHTFSFYFSIIAYKIQQLVLECQV